MKIIKTILAPTDFSIPAGYGVEYAIKLAKKLKASGILYHSFLPFESGFYLLERIKKQNRETKHPSSLICAFHCSQYPLNKP